MPELDEEREWIRRSREGDLNSFGNLVERYQKMIHGLTWRMTGSISDSQDLAQETFVQAYQKLDSFRGGSQFSSWIYKIAVNACLNWRCRELRRQKIHADWTEERSSADSGEQGRELPPDELSEFVQEALNQLPAKQRAAIILTVYEGMNHAQAAQALDCSEATVSWRVFAARARLKKLLNRQKGKVPHGS